MSKEIQVASIPVGLCQCGCGQRTTIPLHNSLSQGREKGKPMRFISGHHTRTWNQCLEKNHQWKGGKRIQDGYVHLLIPEYPRKTYRGYVLEHIVIAEAALGKVLPPNAVVHHVNENRSDNRNSNLLICQDENYHRLIHQRLRAYKACGNPKWRKCKVCKQYDDPSFLTIAAPNSIYHKKCMNSYNRKYYHRIKSDKQSVV